MHSNLLSRWISGGIATAVLWSSVGGTPANANTRPAAALAANPAQTQQPLAVTAGGVRITYLFSAADANGATTANTFKTFLDANGYTVSPVSIAADGSATLNQAGTDLFLIGSETTSTPSGATWAGNDALSGLILSSGKPIVGLGAGGRAFFARSTSALGAAPAACANIPVVFAGDQRDETIAVLGIS